MIIEKLFVTERQDFENKRITLYICLSLSICNKVFWNSYIKIKKFLECYQYVRKQKNLQLLDILMSLQIFFFQVLFCVNYYS